MSEMTVPYIFDIHRASTVDGPGLRTTVFLKGCNLNCFWCHNPEGKSPEPQLARFAEKCVECGTCRSVCRSPDACIACGTCAKHCPSDALRLFGKCYTVDELLEIIAADKPYFDATGGGLTLSGGECMLYPEFVAELARSCQERGISVAIDTAGNVPFSSFALLLPYTDLFLYDVKALDCDLHRRGTGVGNKRILANLQRLIDLKKPILVRIPLIPQFNEGEEVERIQRFCEERDLLYEILPYHRIGESKRDALL